jgi:CRISPR/Cas system-associated protein Csx1
MNDEERKATQYTHCSAIITWNVEVAVCPQLYYGGNLICAVMCEQCAISTSDNFQLHFNFFFLSIELQFEKNKKKRVSCQLSHSFNQLPLFFTLFFLSKRVINQKKKKKVCKLCVGWIRQRRWWWWEIIDREQFT